VTAPAGTVAVRLVGLALAAALIVGCGPGDETTGAGVTGSATNSTATTLVGAVGSPHRATSSTADPASIAAGSSVTGDSADDGVDGGTAAVPGETMSDAELAELERTLDDIDRILSDLDNELNND
jgi:hypothetical protein